MTLDDIKKKYDDVAEIFVWDGKHSVEVSQIIVNPELRNEGIGTKIMQDVIAYADSIGKPVSLSPSKDFGGKIGKLNKFYKGLGFKPNKGRSKDFQISNTMIRPVTESNDTKIPEYTITDEVTGVHSGQTDATLLAQDPDGNVLGYLDYTVYENSPSISYVNVDSKYRRLGIGTQLYKKLQSLYPDKELGSSGTTPDGAAIRKSIEPYLYKDPNKVNAIKTLKSLHRRSREIEKAWDHVYDKEPDVKDKLDAEERENDRKILELEEKYPPYKTGIYGEDPSTFMESFLRSLKRDRNSELVDVIMEGYNIIFEGSNDFNPVVFDELPSFAKRIAYAKSKLPHISSGSSRIVYEVDKNHVLKLARNPKGIAQNDAERDRYIQSLDSVANVIDESDNGLWLISERVDNIKKHEFEQLVGVPFELFCEGLVKENARHKGHNYSGPITDEQMEVLYNTNLWHEMLSLIVNADLLVGDLCRLGSYGKSASGDAVLRDAGFTLTVQQQHYR